MSYVRNISDIERNAFELLDTLENSGADRSLAVKLIKGGRVFYPIHYHDELSFVPSKFIGYRKNTVLRHEKLKDEEQRDGRETNRVIQKILGNPVSDPDLETRLAHFCQSLGAEIESHKHKFWRVEAATRFTSPARSAINDIDSADIGNPDPEYRKRMAGAYVRVKVVRDAVLKRAGGHCEFCSEPGFPSRSGSLFLETHHIISLSEQGPDTPDNVIALCPNDHRRAHFGRDWKALQKRFRAILKARES